MMNLFHQQNCVGHSLPMAKFSCYIGKRRLDRAIELYRKTYPASQNDNFTITWASFYLDPTSPAVDVPIKDDMIQKFGYERVEMILPTLTSIAREEGINFTLGKSKGNNVEKRIVAELFKSYFENGGDITAHSMLLEAAEGAGLARIDGEVQKAYRNGVTGVPDFMIQGKHTILVALRIRKRS
ncbi:DSBA oxidoreductase [Xylaria nigripes]|nr:DSBA oxidoreductase [Xylaria nigripes]